MAINIDLKGLKDLENKLKASDKTMDELMSKVLYDIAARVVEKAVNLSPSDTGLLRRSFFSSFRQDADGSYVCEIYNNTTYARFVEKGHRIVDGNGITIGWVDGVFMLKIAEERAKKELDKYIKSTVDRYIGGLMK